MIPLSAIGIYFVLSSLLYKLLIHPYFLSPLSRIPNAHPTSPLTSLWITRKRHAGIQNKTLLSLHQRHGSVVRLGPKELSVNSLSGLRTIYTGNFPKHAWYRSIFALYAGLPNLVSILDAKSHAVQKRIMAPVFTKSYVQSSEDLERISRAIVCDRLQPTLYDFTENRIETNVLDLLRALGTDFASAYVFGLQHGTDFVRDIPARREWQEWCLNPLAPDKAALEAWCLPLCAAASTYSPSSPSAHSTNPVVYSHVSTGLSKLSPPPPPLTIASEMLDLILAGTETSAITLTYLVYELSRHPELQGRLRRELWTLSPSIPVASPLEASSELPTPKTIDSLPLLAAILTETLRLYPATSVPLPRVTPFSPSGTGIDGYAHIPGGVTISSSAYALHRNADVYPDPETWLPDRWVNQKPEKLEEMKKWFWSFSSGARMCLGRHFTEQGMYRIHRLPRSTGIGAESSQR
jgi:cytochrome P450